MRQLTETTIDRQTDRPQRQRQSDRRAQTCHTQSPTDRQDRPTWRQGLYRDRETQTDTQVLHTESGRQIHSTKDHLRQTKRQTDRQSRTDRRTHRHVLSTTQTQSNRHTSTRTYNSSLPLLLQESPRCRGHSRCQSTLYDICQCSVLSCWRMHSDMNLSFSSELVELYRHSCNMREIWFPQHPSLASRTVTLNHATICNVSLHGFF